MRSASWSLCLPYAWHVAALLAAASCCPAPAESDDWLPTSAVTRWLDAGADRGNRASTAYVTGPHCSIARLYNDDMEVSLWRRPPTLVFSVNKNDVWDRRYFAEGKRLITIDEVRRRCFAAPLPSKPGFVFPGYGGLVGRNSDLGIPNAPHALYLAYDFPCPKPVGQLRLHFPGLQPTAEYKVGRTRSGWLVIEARQGEARVSLRAHLCRTRNVLVIGGRCSGLAQPIRIELYRHRDTTPQGTSVAALANRNGETGYDYSQDRDNGPLPPPRAGHTGDAVWIRQRFHPEPTFPDGFEAVMAAMVDDPAARLTAENDVQGAAAPAAIHAISDETHRRLPGWLKEVRLAAERYNQSPCGSRATLTLRPGQQQFTVCAAAATTRDAADPLTAAAGAARRALRSGMRSLALSDARLTPQQLREWRLSRVMHYNATSCTYYDATPWHGDYHFNEGYFLPSIVNGDLDALEQRLQLFEEMLPALRRHAQEVFHCKGICFPLVHYPIKTDRVVYTNVTWEWGIENTAFMLQPFWQMFQYTQDGDFLRQRVYPLMREAARFYADYVTRGSDGFYHVTPTVSQEHWGFTPHFRLNEDSVGALSFIKYHLKACLRAAGVLGVDTELAQRWRDIVDHLAPYPTLDTPDGPVFCDVRHAPRLLNYNITANLVMSLFAEDISLDSPPQLLEMARRSYAAIPDKEHSMRPGYLRRLRLYLGMLEKPWLCPQGRVLSWPGRIHLYAGVPTGMSVEDRFSGLLAVGGFEVSACHAGKRVCDVRIRSRAGGVCRLKNPWFPQTARVFEWPSRRATPVREEGDTLVFDTSAGRTYALLSGEETALARMRFQPQEEVIAKWTFDALDNGQVTDASGHEHHARLLHGAALVAVPGGKALALNGQGAHALVQRTPAFDFAARESFAIQLRVKAPFRLDGAGTPLLCSMATKQYCLFIDRGRVRFYLSSPRGQDYAFVDGKTFVADERWHDIRVVRDVNQGQLEVYVDGRLDATAPDTTGGDFASQAPIALGAYLWGAHTRYAECWLDDVAIVSLGKLTASR